MIKFLLALWRLISVWKRVKRVGDQHEQVAGVDALPSPKRRIVVKPKPITATAKQPWLRQPGETAGEWWERTTKDN